MRILLCWLLAMCVALSAAAQDEIRAFVSAQRVGVGQELTLTVVIAGNTASSINFPDAEGFTKGQSSFNAKGNDNVYTQIYVAQQRGTFRIPAFMVTMSGRGVTIPSHFVEIVGGKVPNTASAASAGNTTSPASSNLRYEETQVEAFLKVEMSETAVFVGQPIRVDIRLYVKEADRSRFHYEAEEVTALRQRAAKGTFWQEAAAVQPSEMTETVKGTRYVVKPLHKMFVVPQQDGRLALEQVYLDAEKQWIAKSAGQSTYRPFRVKAADMPTVVVKALPSTSLPNASRAFGQFSIQGRLAQNPAKTGEPMQVIVEVFGIGNAPLIPAPILPIDDRSFVAYDPGAQYTPQSASDLRGIKRFTYEITPAMAGTFTFPPAKLYFYNATTNRYDSVLSQPLTLTVEGENKPKLVAARRLDNFYESAMEQATDEPLPQIPGLRYIAWALLAITVGFAVWGWLRK